jgi:hypothetical protein
MNLTTVGDKNRIVNRGIEQSLKYLAEKLGHSRHFYTLLPWKHRKWQKTYAEAAERKINTL